MKAYFSTIKAMLMPLQMIPSNAYVKPSPLLLSSPDLFSEECDNLKGIFLKLKYPENRINPTITRFIEFKQMRPFELLCRSGIKDQRSADVVQRQLSDLGKK